MYGILVISTLGFVLIGVQLIVNSFFYCCLLDGFLICYFKFYFFVSTITLFGFIWDPKCSNVNSILLPSDDHDTINIFNTLVFVLFVSFVPKRNKKGWAWA